MQRSVFTNRTRLTSVSEEAVVNSLHDHGAMITQNPLVIHHQRCQPPADAPPDEAHAVWYQLTDRIDYLPGGLLQGRIRYRACFHDTPRGLRTHIYAPMGVDIRNHWSVCRGEGEGGEELYLHEEVELRCPFGTAGFVRRTLTRAHSRLVERML